MKTMAPATALVAGLVVAVMLLPMASSADTEGARTLTGRYFMDSGDDTGALEAVFTPAGDGTWTVAFHFEFQNQPHLYIGTAQGSLTNGPLRGEVKVDHPDATFVFEGTVTDGTFQGIHGELQGGEPVPAGTLTLG